MNASSNRGKPLDHRSDRCILCCIPWYDINCEGITRMAKRECSRAEHQSIDISFAEWCFLLYQVLQERVEVLRLLEPRGLWRVNGVVRLYDKRKPRGWRPNMVETRNTKVSNLFRWVMFFYFVPGSWYTAACWSAATVTWRGHDVWHVDKSVGTLVNGNGITRRAKRKQVMSWIPKCRFIFRWVMCSSGCSWVGGGVTCCSSVSGTSWLYRGRTHEDGMTKIVKSWTKVSTFISLSGVLFYHGTGTHALKSTDCAWYVGA